MFPLYNLDLACVEAVRIPPSALKVTEGNEKGT
jgi:hypothetical protein